MSEMPDTIMKLEVTIILGIPCVSGIFKSGGSVDLKKYSC